MTLIARPENEEWFFIDDMRGPVPLPDVVDDQWMKDRRVQVRSKRKPYCINAAGWAEAAFRSPHQG